MIVSKETMVKLAEHAMSEPDGIDKVYAYVMEYFKNAKSYGIPRTSCIAAVVDLLRNKLEADASRKNDFETLSTAYKAALSRYEELSKGELMPVEEAVALIEAAADKEKNNV